MQIEFDATKQAKTLAERGLDFADAVQVFAGPQVTLQDTRMHYGEDRFMTFGSLRGRLVLVVWTPRGAARRIVSMRYINERETAKYGPALG